MPGVNSRVPHALHPSCQAAVAQLYRSGKVRVTMSTVQSYGHRGRSFASWRLGVFALSDRTALLEERYEKACGGRGGDAGFSGGLEVSFLTRRRKGAKAQRKHS